MGDGFGSFFSSVADLVSEKKTYRNFPDPDPDPDQESFSSDPELCPDPNLAVFFQ